MVFLDLAEKLQQQLGNDIVPAQPHDQQDNAGRPECTQKDHIDDPGEHADIVFIRFLLFHNSS